MSGLKHSRATGDGRLRKRMQHEKLRKVKQKKSAELSTGGLWTDFPQPRVCDYSCGRRGRNTGREHGCHVPLLMKTIKPQIPEAPRTPSTNDTHVRAEAAEDGGPHAPGDLPSPHTHVRAEAAEDGGSHPPCDLPFPPPPTDAH